MSRPYMSSRLKSWQASSVTANAIHGSSGSPPSSFRPWSINFNRYTTTKCRERKRAKSSRARSGPRNSELRHFIRGFEEFSKRGSSHHEHDHEPRTHLNPLSVILHPFVPNDYPHAQSPSRLRGFSESQSSHNADGSRLSLLCCLLSVACLRKFLVTNPPNPVESETSSRFR